MTEQSPRGLGVFELPLVLLPGERVPLHIFEERYKRMIGHSLENDQPFGILFRDEEGARAVGCLAHVSEVLERFDDGRLNVLVTGGRPFEALGREDGAIYPTAEIEVLDELDEEVDQGAGDAAREALERLVELVDEELDEVPGDAYGIAARVELPTELKQQLLEERSESVRLSVVTKALEELARTVRRSRKMRERAATNGHGPIA